LQQIQQFARAALLVNLQRLDPPDPNPALNVLLVAMAQVALINAQDLALSARSPLQAAPPVPSALLERLGLQPD